MKIIRSLRKSISLQLDTQGVLIVKAPIFVTDRKIQLFIASHHDWIEKQKGNILKHIKQYVSGEEFYFLGHKYPLKIIETTSIENKKQARLRTRPLEFTGTEFVLVAGEEKNAKHHFEKFYKSEMKQYMQAILPGLAEKYKLKYNKLSVTSAKTRWGSCSSKKNINFTFRLIMAPKLSIDYVIIHELSHLVHMNHSFDFWNHVDRMFYDVYNQDYNIHQNWLKKEGSTLIF